MADKPNTDKQAEIVLQPQSNMHDELTRIREDVTAIRLGNNSASSARDLKDALKTDMDGAKAVEIAKNIPGTAVEYGTDGQPTAFTFGGGKPVNPAVKVDLRGDTVNGKSDRDLKLDAAADNLFRKIHDWDKESPDRAGMARQGLQQLAQMGDPAAKSVLNRLADGGDLYAKEAQNQASIFGNNGKTLSAHEAADWMLKNNRDQLHRHELDDLLMLGQGGDQYANNVIKDLQHRGARVSWSSSGADYSAYKIDLHGIGKKH